MEGVSGEQTLAGGGGLGWGEVGARGSSSEIILVMQAGTGEDHSQSSGGGKEP